METPRNPERPEATDGLSHGIQSSHQEDLQRILGTIGFDFTSMIQGIASPGTHERNLQKIGRVIGFDFPRMMEYITSETHDILDSRIIKQ